MVDQFAADEREFNVVVTAPGFDSFGDLASGRLRAAGCSVANHGPSADRTERDVARLLAGADAAILSADPVSDLVLSQASRLRVIARLGVGTDSIDLESASKRAVVVTTTPGLNDETCADHALALMLAAVRRIPEHDASVRDGKWERGGDLTPWDLHHKRIGVIGYGRIGRAVVRRLTGFNVEIRVYDPQAQIKPDIACPSLEELLNWANVLTIHAPLTPETRGLIGARELGQLRPGAIVVNTSRGGLVDEAALLAALSTGDVRAAALDVFKEEPPLDPGWHDLANVVLSPHIGGLSVESIESMAQQCVDQVLTVMAGGQPQGVVNPDAFADGSTQPKVEA